MKNNIFINNGMKVKCLACENELSHSDTIVDFEKEKIVKCPSCRSWNYLPRPIADEQILVHNTHDYFEHEYFKKRRQITPRLRKRCITTFKRLNHGIISNQLDNKPVLDLGCDTGSFILCASDIFNIIPYGVDVSSKSIEIASKNGVLAFCGRLDDAPKNMSGYSIITAIDVIEHVVDPKSLLKEVYKRLAPGGFVYIETPNPGSLIYSLGKFLSKYKFNFLKAPLHRLFPPQHLICFSKDALKEISTKSGFSIKSYGTRTLPCKDLTVSPIYAIGILICQMFDIVTQQKILHWIVLEKPK